MLGGPLRDIATWTPVHSADAGRRAQPWRSTHLSCLQHPTFGSKVLPDDSLKPPKVKESGVQAMTWDSWGLASQA